MSRIQFFILGFFLINSGLIYSQDFPTIGEVYNYDIGDIFHERDVHYYSGEFGEFSDTVRKNIEVMDKYFSDDYDTVYYYLFIQKQAIYESEPQNNSNTEYYITSRINNLELIQEGDTVFENPEFFNGRKTVKEYYEYVEGPEEYTSTQHWTVGCGRVSDYDTHWSWNFLSTEISDTRLVYFKKGDEEWGEEQLILGSNEIESNIELVFYPNPSRDKLNIVLPASSLKESKIQIYNTAGELLMNKEIHSSKLQINLSFLPNGLYLINQIDEFGNINARSKFIKVD